MHILVAVGLLVLVPGTTGEKILLFPLTTLFNSRSMNIEKIAVQLQENGHLVSMLVSDHYKPRMNISGVELITYKMPETWVNKGGVLDLNSTLNVIENDPLPLISEIDNLDFMLVDTLFDIRDTVQYLKDSEFSLFFYDMTNSATGYFLNHYLQIPCIAYNNFGLFESWFYFNQPIFPSFTPYSMSEFTDKMNFWERLQNTDFITEAHDWTEKKIETTDKLRLKHFPNKNWPSAKHAFQKVSVIIAANVNFVFDYPRPIMPHVKPISGLLWTPPKPLPKLYRDLVASSTHGVILMSFGTLLPTFEPEKAEILAKVFARLQQKVIWRYQGDPPKSLGKNTHLVKWFPQNDLLAHPAIKLFITHCGASSVWETLYHAVPVVAIPLAWDQPYHAKKLTERAKIGEIVKYSSLSETNLMHAIDKVLNNNSYKSNAVKISKVLKDTPITGQKELIFWVNYVIRHNGTLHFHSQATYGLNWYQYYLLDVIAYKAMIYCILSLVYILLGIIIWKLVKLLFRCLKPEK